MGRREAPVDPDAGPVQRFAFELRKLRQEAGGPTYRVMAERAGYSVTALSQAAAGERLPSMAIALAYAGACGGDEHEWERRWRETAQEVAAQPRPESDTKPPYRGLARFEPGDADLFFGRDRIVGQMTELAARRRFVAVFGPSGSGKSSLLRAGFIPRLRRAEDPGLRPATVRVLTPGAHPPSAVDQRLVPKTDSDGDTWLVIDQFEELFTLCSDPAERTAFIDRLLTAQDPDSRLRVVIAVRADFLGHCTEHPGLTAALQDATVLTGPMSRDELRETIVKPAQASGLIVERSLTARILAEVGDEPGALPLMSHALLETWRHHKGRALTETAYDAAGGLHGAITRTAEEVYSRLTAAQAAIARRVLLRLVTPGNGTPDTRRPADRDELDLSRPHDATTVVESLVRARLLTHHGSTVDLAHEALITAWPRLHSWVDAERDRLRAHRLLTEAALAWQDLDRDPGALYRGSRLAAAEDAFPVPERPQDLTPTERAFLAASEQRQRRATRLRRTVTSALVALVLIASGTAALAFQQRAEAQSERNTAQAQRNAAVFNRITVQADGLRGTQPSLAAQLDLTAHRMQPTSDLYTHLVTDANTALSTPLTGHTGIVTSVAFSPDRRTLASAGYDRVVRLWDVTDPTRPEPLGEPLTGHGNAVYSVSFSPDGDTLATAGEDRTVRLWDVSDPSHPDRLGRPLTGHEDAVTALAFSPDGNTLATASDDRTARLWDVTDPERPTRTGKPLSGHDDDVVGVAFSPDGKTLATAGNDRTARLWDVTDPERPRSLSTLTGHEAAVWSVAFSPDRRTMATAGFDHTVRLWDVTDPARPEPLGEPLTGHTAAVWSVTFSPDGRTLASAGYDDTVRLWNITNPAYALPLGKPLTDHTDGIWSVTFSPDGRTLASAGYDRTVRLWHRPSTLLTGYRNPVNAVAFSREGHLLATPSSDDHTVRLWDLKDPARPTLLAKLTDHKGPVTSVAFSPDGHTMASAGEDRTVRLWNLKDPARPVAVGRPMTGHTEPVRSVAFGPDGRTLASGGEDHTVRLWDVSDPGRPRILGSPLTGHENTVTSVAFSPDGDTLASAGSDNTVRLWNVRDPARPAHRGRPLTGYDESVTSVAFSPDGKTLASGSEDRTVRLWDLEDLSRPVVLSGHREPVRSVAFSPDGDTLASAGDDHTVRLWNVRDPARPTHRGQPLTGHTDTVTSVAFSPDGRTLATSSYDVTARVWQLDVEQAAQRICTTTAGVLTSRHWQRYVPQLPYRPPCG